MKPSLSLTHELPFVHTNSSLLDFSESSHPTFSFLLIFFLASRSPLHSFSCHFHSSFLPSLQHTLVAHNLTLNSFPLFHLATPQVSVSSGDLVWCVMECGRFESVHLAGFGCDPGGGQAVLPLSYTTSAQSCLTHQPQDHKDSLKVILLNLKIRGLKYIQMGDQGVTSQWRITPWT